MTPDLATTYLGLPLRSPLVVGAAAPLSDDLAQLQALERAGAAAIVLHSLFEEQIEQEQLDLYHRLGQGAESYGEALSYVQEPSIFHGGEDLYLRHLEQACQRLAVPVIASGGAGCIDHIAQALDAGHQGGHASAALLASLLHDGVLTVEEIKLDLLGRGFNIRPLA